MESRRCPRRAWRLPARAIPQEHGLHVELLTHSVPLSSDPCASGGVEAVALQALGRLVGEGKEDGVVETVPHGWVVAETDLSVDKIHAVLALLVDPIYFPEFCGVLKTLLPESLPLLGDKPEDAAEPAVTAQLFVSAGR